MFRFVIVIVLLLRRRRQMMKSERRDGTPLMDEKKEQLEEWFPAFKHFLILMSTFPFGHRNHASVWQCLGISRAYILQQKKEQKIRCGGKKKKIENWGKTSITPSLWGFKNTPFLIHNIYTWIPIQLKHYKCLITLAKWLKVMLKNFDNSIWIWCLFQIK